MDFEFDVSKYVWIKVSVHMDTLHYSKKQTSITWLIRLFSSEWVKNIQKRLQIWKVTKYKVKLTVFKKDFKMNCREDKIFIALCTIFTKFLEHCAFQCYNQCIRVPMLFPSCCARIVVKPFDNRKTRVTNPSVGLSTQRLKVHFLCIIIMLR